IGQLGRLLAEFPVGQGATALDEGLLVRVRARHMSIDEEGCGVFGLGTHLRPPNRVAPDGSCALALSRRSSQWCIISHTHSRGKCHRDRVALRPYDLKYM